MYKSPPTFPLPPGKTGSLHIGHDRFAVATQFAIDVSSDTRVQITPSKFVQHLFDHYGEVAKRLWKVTVCNPPVTFPHLPPGATGSISIGHERFFAAEQFSIDLSNDTRIQISPSQFVQHLIDYYSSRAKENWGLTLANAQIKD